jgi:hypothetical protein
MPALPPYIPPRDADLANWSANFTTLLTAAPPTYGLTTTDASNVAAVQATWAADYAAAINPATRTPVAVTAKDTARVGMLAIVRPLAQAISINAGVLTSDKIAIGVNPRTSVPSPITAPTTSPVLTIASGPPLTHIIRFRDEMSSPTVKAKPYGVAAMQLVGTTGGLPTVGGGDAPDLLPLAATLTKAPALVSWPSNAAGLTAKYFARWITRTGLVGPWSAEVDAIVA